MPRPRPAPLPAYALYGEPLAGGAPDPLHCESIAERSRLHGWEIRPHRHEALFQLLVVERGRAEAWLDGAVQRLQGPAAITVPALAAHGFRFSPSIEGMVFTLAEPRLAALLQPHPGLAAAVLRLQGAALGPEAAAVLGAARGLRDEALGHAGWRAAALDAGLLALAVGLARGRAAAGAAAPRRAAANGAAPPPGARALAHVQRLRALVESQFRRQPSQAALAAQLGITPTQLNRACRALLGHPAQAVLHARLVLQAQRELAYTELGVKQIAFELGFSDAAYFTRFFRARVGLPPAAWRAAQRRAAGGAAQV